MKQNLKYNAEKLAEQLFCERLNLCSAFLDVFKIEYQLRI